MNTRDTAQYARLTNRWIVGDHSDELRDAMKPYALKYAAERVLIAAKLARSLTTA